MGKTLHIFNPGHDLALAADLDNFTPPHAARALRSSLDYIPALWADDGDVVLVDDKAHAMRAFSRLCQQVAKFSSWRMPQVEFVEAGDIAGLAVSRIDPWGWDRSLCHYLARVGVDASLMPDAETLRTLRMESHRRTARLLRDGIGVTEAYECGGINEIILLIYKYNKVVVKAPWSSSGRGIRFLSDVPDKHTQGWLRNTIAMQKSVMVEPYYNKVLDFGLEFIRHDDGAVEYLGLSMFQTVHGAYIGNLLATENVKRQKLSRYLSLDILDRFISKASGILSAKLTYTGPFGIDMMVVEGGLLALAEINLRRTMGHVALRISPVDDDVRKVMRIETGNIYKLRVLSPQS